MASRDDWHRPLRHVAATELSAETGQTAGMNRREAVSGKTVGAEKVWMLSIRPCNSSRATACTARFSRFVGPGRATPAR